MIFKYLCLRKQVFTAFLVLLFISSVSFCTAFGSSKIAINREWNITGEPADIVFTGMLIVNNSNQKVISIETDPVLSVKSEGEEIFVVYNGTFNGSATYRASAVAIIDYNTNIKNDEQLSGIPINGNISIAWDESIKQTADSVSSNSSKLEAIEKIANWVNSNMQYDISYFGMSKSAQETMNEKRGVCVEYTHLFISMMNALGVQARYVGGYASTENSSWQAHSWAEVYADGQWIPVDPTFSEAGILDSSHVILSYGPDASGIYDKVISYSEKPATQSITSATEIEMLEDKTSDKGNVVRITYDQTNSRIYADATNSRDDYVFGAYRLIVPSEYGGEKHKVVLLKPHGAYRDYAFLDPQKFQDGYIYTIPVRASFNDASDMNNVIIEKAASQKGAEPEKKKICGSAFILAFIFVGALLAFNKR